MFSCSSWSPRRLEHVVTTRWECPLRQAAVILSPHSRPCRNLQIAGKMARFSNLQSWILWSLIPQSSWIPWSWMGNHIPKHWAYELRLQPILRSGSYCYIPHLRCSTRLSQSTCLFLHQEPQPFHLDAQLGHPWDSLQDATMLANWVGMLSICSGVRWSTSSSTMESTIAILLMGALSTFLAMVTRSLRIAMEVWRNLLKVRWVVRLDPLKSTSAWV